MAIAASGVEQVFRLVEPFVEVVEPVVEFDPPRHLGAAASVFAVEHVHFVLDFVCPAC